MINQETKLAYANSDPSMHCNGRTVQVPDWRNEYLELIKREEYDAAHELRLRSDESYRERCEQEAASVFPVTSPELKSCREYSSEIKELEVA